MNLIDTSAWIEFLRGSRSRATDEVRRLLDTELDGVVTCEPIAMELLAGARDDAGLARLERLVDGLPGLAVDPTLDFRAAASIFRTGRRAGLTIRSLNDCLIAAVAIRYDATVVHQDVDFEVIAQLTPLKSRSLRQPRRPRAR